MEHTSYYEYTVSSHGHHHQNPYINIDLTCTQILRRRILVAENLLISLPDETKIFYIGGLTRFHHTTYNNSSTVAADITRLNGTTTLITRSINNTINRDNYLLINCHEISQILRRFGVTDYGCSTIVREIDDAVEDLKERGGGVIKVNVWKIMNHVDNRCGEQRLLIERIWSKSKSKSKSELDDLGEGCVICMEEYEEGRVVGRLRSCDHEFHGVCIKEWLKINTHCPLCRSSLLH